MELKEDIGALSLNKSETAQNMVKIRCKHGEEALTSLLKKMIKDIQNLTKISKMIIKTSHPEKV